MLFLLLPFSAFQLLTQKLLGLTLAARGAVQRSLLLGSHAHRGGGASHGLRSGAGGPGSGATPGSLDWATWQVEEYANWLETRVVSWGEV